ncbi:MAG: exodeoxyribonuclease VII large subunit [Campylobacterales bacterium]
MEKRLKVSELLQQVGGVLEGYFQKVVVEGEVSRPKPHPGTGHFYFTLKDAEGSIDGVVWKSWIHRLKRLPKEGEKVVVVGKLSLFRKGGKCTIACYSITPLSQPGDLALQLEELKRRLWAKGYFDPRLKKPLSPYPKRIAIVTSKSGAALRDMLRIARNRWQLTQLFIFDTLVQGEGAPASIAKGIGLADRLGWFDLIIVGRGGGSLEDLWAFNSEVVADAIFRAKTPIISAVGHEVDHLLSDEVADRRASTPSNAIEIALPDRQEEIGRINYLKEQFRKGVLGVLERKGQERGYLWRLFREGGLEGRLQREKAVLEGFRERFQRGVEGLFHRKKGEAERLKGEFHRLNPGVQLGKWEERVQGFFSQFTREFTGILEGKGREMTQLREGLEEGIGEVLREKRGEIERLKELFSQLDPRRGRQFLAEIWREGEKGLERVRLGELKPGEKIRLITPDGEGVVLLLEFHPYQ